MIKDIMNKDIKQIMSLCVIFLVASLVLYGVYTLTKPKIDETNNAVFNDKLSRLYPGLESSEHIDNYFVAYGPAKSIMGYAVETSSYGYQSDIHLLVGFDQDKTLTAVVVLSQMETPGIGTKIEEDSFLNLWNYKKKDAAKLKQNGGDVDAITGATVSSKAFEAAVQEAFTNLPN